MSEENQNKSLEFLNNPEFAAAIKGYSGWGKFISITQYFGAGISITVGLIYLVMGIFMAFAGGSEALGIALFILIYCIVIILFSVASILMGLKLWKSTEKVASLARSASVDDYIQKSASNISLMRSYFKYQGIMFICYIVVTIVLVMIYFVAMIFFVAKYDYSSGTSTNYDSSYQIDSTPATAN